MYEKLQDIYSSSSDIVRARGMNEVTATSAYSKYLDFVQKSSPEGKKLLDVGCGSGWSSYLFSQNGYQTTGVDLNQKAFEPPVSNNLSFIQGSCLSLPFNDAEFDIVSSNQMLEHVPSPEKALREMVRVLKPEGTICIVGPNLLSLGTFALSVTKYVWQKERILDVFIRSSTMPKHPWGNTLPEVIFSFPGKISLIIKKSMAQKPSFSMREPDINPPFTADNDACYLLNPIDLVKFMPTLNCVIIQNGLYGRPSWTNMLASGTFVACRKL